MPPHSRVLVAVSGGADSTALLLVLRSLAYGLQIEVHAAHLNHGLRGADADADAAFVAALCSRCAVPLHAARWNTPQRMSRRGLTGENGLRILRREFLESVAGRIDARAIATAHTSDDQLETLLLRLLRGTGLRGLGGMRPRHGRWIKPMLDVTRVEVERALSGARQAWRTDDSNADPALARNRVRHGVIPALLAAAGPAATRDSLARRTAALATELRDAEAALRRWTRPLGRVALADDDATIRLPITRYRRFPLAARRELLRSLWRQVATGGLGMTAAHLAQVDHLAAGARGPVALPGGYFAIRDGGAILMAPARIQQGSLRRPRRLDALPMPLPLPGHAELGGLRVQSSWTSAGRARAGISENAQSREYFAAEGIRGTLEVRPARADETFIPYGRSRPVRLREFMNALPARSRAATPTVLADDSGILWVIGVRRSSRAPVQPSTRKVLCVHAERHD